MILKYRAYIDGEFYYFDLEWLANIHPYLTQRLITNGGNCECIMEPSYIPCKECMKVSNVIEWFHAGNQPDVFIGIQDKNKVDIYENDIALINDEIKDVVKWHGDEDYPAFDVGEILSECNTIAYCKIDLEGSIEIIGNTHENGDLLK